MNNDINNAPQQAAELPPFLNIVEGYLWGINGQPTGKTPGSFNTKHLRVITSQEIVLELADMVDLELNDVAKCMTALGYVCGSADGKLGWFVEINH